MTAPQPVSPLCEGFDNCVSDGATVKVVDIEEANNVPVLKIEFEVAVNA